MRDSGRLRHKHWGLADTAGAEWFADGVPRWAADLGLVKNESVWPTRAIAVGVGAWRRMADKELSAARAMHQSLELPFRMREPLGRVQG